MSNFIFFLNENVPPHEHGVTPFEWIGLFEVPVSLFLSWLLFSSGAKNARLQRAASEASDHSRNIIEHKHLLREISDEYFSKGTKGRVEEGRSLEFQILARLERIREEIVSLRALSRKFNFVHKSQVESCSQCYREVKRAITGHPFQSTFEKFSLESELILKIHAKLQGLSRVAQKMAFDTLESHR